MRRNCFGAESSKAKGFIHRAASSLSAFSGGTIQGLRRSDHPYHPSGNTPLLRARVTKWRASFILASSKGRKARPGRGKSGYNYNPRCPLMQLHKDISRLGVSSTNRHPLLHSPDISARDYYFGSLLTTVRKRLLHYVCPDRFRHQSDMFTAIE